MLLDVAVGEIGDCRGVVGGSAVGGGILTLADCEEDLERRFAGLLDRHSSIATQGEEAPPPLGPIRDDKGLATTGVDPQTKGGDLGIPEVAAAVAVVAGFVDGALVEPGFHGRPPEVRAQGLDLGALAGWRWAGSGALGSLAILGIRATQKQPSGGETGGYAALTMHPP